MTKWISSEKFEGVRWRLHPTRKHGIHPDKYFTIRYQIDGKRQEESLGWASEEWTESKAFKKRCDILESIKTGSGPTSLRHARKIEQKKVQEELAQEEAERKSKIKFGEYFSKVYLPAHSHKKQASLTAETGLFNNWIKPVIGKTPLPEVTEILLNKIKRNMENKDKSPRTIDYMKSVIRQVFNHAIDNGDFEGRNPAGLLKVKRKDNKRSKYFTVEQVKLLLKSLKEKSPQWHDICLLSVYTGLRAGEIFNLEWSDVDFKRKRLFIKDPKSSKNRYSILHTNTLEMLKHRKAIYPNYKYVFVSQKKGKIKEVSNTVAKVIDELKFNEDCTDPRKKLVFHSLRHTAASWLINQGHDLYLVSKILGHSDIKTTQRYAHLADEHQEQAINSLPDITESTEDSDQEDTNTTNLKIVNN